MLSNQLSLYVNPRGQCVMHFSGFSVLAGLVPVVWALHRRLYKVSVVALFYTIALNALVAQLGFELQVLLYLIQYFLFGFYANRMHQWFLERGGWIQTEAESKFISEAKE